MKTDDQLDDVFGLLKARSRERECCDFKLEERLMKEFGKVSRPGISRFSKLMAVAVLCLTAVTAVAEVTTGGVSNLVNKVFITGFVGPEGQKLDFVGTMTNEDGTITLQVVADESSSGEQGEDIHIKINIDDVENDE